MIGALEVFPALHALLPEELSRRFLGRPLARSGELQERVLLGAHRGERFRSVLGLPAGGKVELEPQPGMIERVALDEALLRILAVGHAGDDREVFLPVSLEL